MDFTSTWHWPQWTILILILIPFLAAATSHGKPRLQTAGDEKGLPERYNGFIALSRFAILLFVLIAGGFFA